MSEETIDQKVEEVATSQNEHPSNPELGDAIAESKKYRSRAQKVEAELANLQKQVEDNRTTQMEEQNQWKVLAEERKAQIDSLTPIVDRFKADESKYMDELLSDFSDEDRETFKELPVNQLRVVHNKLINKPNVPNVDSTPAGAYQGYDSLVDAAKDVALGKLNKTAYAKVKEAFTSRIN